jgi:hypothetical protein
MWIPKTVQEIESAIAAGTLVETAAFDGKAMLPAVSAKNIDLAIDVAAMATAGGVLLYGVKEDRNKRLTEPRPFALAGAPERVAQIVETSIAEVPTIRTLPFPKAADPSIGFLVVVVPQSPRAPHQVTVGGDLRFYGRGATGNRILTEQEVALLYQRRLSWERDRDQLLAETIAAAPFAPDPDQGYLHAFARPLAPDPELWERALTAAGNEARLQSELQVAATRPQVAPDYSPRLDLLAQWDDLGADRVRLSTLRDERDDAQAHRAVDLVLDADGSGRLFSGRAVYTDQRWSDPAAYKRIFLEVVIAGNLASFLTTLGRLYDLAQYHGQVDVGVAVTGVIKAQSTVTTPHGPGYVLTRAYGADDYRRTTRVSAHELLEPKPLVRSLLRRLFRTPAGQPAFDPFG